MIDGEEPEEIQCARAMLDWMIEDSRQRLSPESYAALHDEATKLVAAYEAISVGARRDAILIATSMLQLSVAEDCVSGGERPERPP